MPPSLINLIMIGNGAVGKTSILQMYRKSIFNQNHIATIGLDYIETKFTPAPGENQVDVKIWDTAGQERFRTITYSFYKHGDGVFFVFDVTNRKSFDQIQSWMSSVEEHAGSNVNSILIGNKIDLEDERVVTEEEARHFASKFKLKYFETSAKTNIGIQEAIQELMKQVHSRKDQERKSIGGGDKKSGGHCSGGFQVGGSIEKKKQGGCCK